MQRTLAFKHNISTRVIKTSQDGLVHDVNHLQGVGDDGVRFGSLLDRRAINGDHRVLRGLRKWVRSISQVGSIASAATSDVEVSVTSQGT